MSMGMPVTLEFTGGAELLFGNKKRNNVLLPLQESPWTLKLLLQWIKSNMLKEREELFICGDSVRPGILVLVNETDWELIGELNYVIQPDDNIMFISTLHGG